MVEEFLGETAGPSKCPSDPMAQAAIIPFYPNRIPLANQLGVLGKGRQKTIPAVGRHRIVGYS
jgi:hypothetical protein